MNNYEARKIPLESLRFDERNARVHDKDNEEAVRRSLEKFGQVEPLVVRKETMKVIGGNCRLKVMRELGYDHALCMVLDISIGDAIALGIALNRTGELARWNEKQLIELLMELEEVGEDTMVTGFNSQQLAAMIDDASKDVDDLDAELPAEVERNSSEGVRVVQLRFDSESLDAFKGMVGELSHRYGLNSMTDIVTRAVKDAILAGA